MMFAVAPAAGRSSPNDSARTFLASAFGVTPAELARLDAGHAVSRTLGASDRREVATIGVVRMKVTPEFYVDRLADIVTFKRDEAVLQVGRFGASPGLQDVASLTLDDSDIRDLRACRVGDCGVQLSSEAISRFRRDVDWARGDARQHADALMRRILVDYVAEYVNAGPAAAMQYADRAPLVHLGREFASLVESDAGGWGRFPDLRRHLLEYPETDTPGTTDLVYWSKEKVGRRAVVSVTHLAIARTTGRSPADYAIASKHIYGTHYFDASLGFTVLLRDQSSASPGTYVVYVNRSRVDIFGGLFGGVTRTIVTSRARTAVAAQLAKLRLRLERESAAARK